MAKKSSTRSGPRSGSQKSQDETVAPETAGEMGGDTVVLGDDTLGEDAVAAEPGTSDQVTIEPGDTTAAEDPAPSDPAPTEIVEPEPAPVTAAPVVEKRGPGMGALLIGGVVAAALGYGAAVFGFSNTNDTSATDAALAETVAAMEAQQSTITALEAQVAALAAVEPPVIPEVDLSGVETAIAGVSAEVSSVASDVAGLGTAIDAITGRVAALEDRPIFTGEVAADTAAMTEAVEALEARIAAEQAAAAEAVTAAEAAAAEATAAAEAAQAEAAAEAQAAAEAAEAAIAQAEAQAAAEAAAAQTEAALSRVQIAVDTGAPFAEALAQVSGDIPEVLLANAEAGVATLEQLQAAYPDVARAALPIALREEAGEGGAADRAAAFLLGQIGGRSVEPREGTDPDAVLSRVGAAVTAGDLATALTEISALPDGAAAMMNDWVTQVETRVAADAALAELAATLDE